MGKERERCCRVFQRTAKEGKSAPTEKYSFPPPPWSYGNDKYALPLKNSVGDIPQPLPVCRTCEIRRRSARRRKTFFLTKFGRICMGGKRRGCK